MLNLKLSLSDAIQLYTDNSKSEKDHKTALNSTLLKVNGAKSILPLVLALKESLTNASTLSRQRSFLLLSLVMKRLPTLNISKDELDKIIDFCIQRLKDYACEGEILLCFAAMYQTRLDLVVTQMKPILEGVFASVNLQAHSQNIRQTTLEMLNQMICNNNNNSDNNGLKSIIVNDLQPPGLFVQGYLKFVENEKDPRCLLLSFNIFTQLCRIYPYNTISQFSEELFDTISCYFPIEFTPPKNDIHGITSDELRSSLLLCFSCHSALSVHSLPFLLEKFENIDECEKMSEKYDIIHALQVCCQEYGLVIIQSYLALLYQKLKSQVLYGNDEELLSSSSSDSPASSITTIDACIEVIVCVVRLICDPAAQMACKQASFTWGNDPHASGNAPDASAVVPNVHIADTNDLNDVENNSQPSRRTGTSSDAPDASDASNNATNAADVRKDESDAKRKDEALGTLEIAADSLGCVGWVSFLEPLIKDFQGELKIPDAKMARTFARIVVGAAGANETAFCLVMRHVWHDMEMQYRDCLTQGTEMASKRQALLELIAELAVLLRDLDCSQMDAIVDTKGSNESNASNEAKNGAISAKRRDETQSDENGDISLVPDVADAKDGKDGKDRAARMVQYAVPVNGMFRLLMDTLDSLDAVGAAAADARERVDTNCMVFVALSHLADAQKREYLRREQVQAVVDRIYGAYEQLHTLDAKDSNDSNDVTIDATEDGKEGADVEMKESGAQRDAQSAQGGMRRAEDVLNRDLDSGRKAQYVRIIFGALSRICRRYSDVVMEHFIRPLGAKHGVIQDVENVQNAQNVEKNEVGTKDLKAFLTGATWIINAEPGGGDSSVCFHDFVLSLVLQPLSRLVRVFLERGESEVIFAELMECVNIVANMVDKLCVRKRRIGASVSKQILDTFLFGLVEKFDFEPAQGVTHGMLERLFVVICFVLSRLVNNSELCEQQSGVGASDASESEVGKLVSGLVEMVWKFKMNSKLAQYKLLCVLVVLAALPRRFNNDVMARGRDGKLLSQLQILIFSLSGEVTNDNLSNYYLQCFATLLNKGDLERVIVPFVTSKSFTSLLNQVQAYAQDATEEQIDPSMVLLVYYVVYVLKALVIRCYQHNIKELLLYLCNLLLSKKQVVGKIAASGFDIIMTDSKLVLNKQVDCKISLLYKQKFFDETIGILLKLLEKKGDGNGMASNGVLSQNNKDIYPLLALSYMMRSVPNAVVNRHLSKLLPLMVRSLCCDLESLKTSTVFSFEMLLNNNLESVVTHLHSIVPQFLVLSKYEKSEKVRVAAIECLTMLTKLEYTNISQYVKQITKGLLHVLDDPKKSVRKCAVKCRNQWYLVST